MSQFNSPAAAAAMLAHAREGWSDLRVAQLTRFWTVDGFSAAEIARRLGVSRNAVLGKVHRLGLSNRGPRRAQRSAPSPKPPRPRRPAREPKPVTRRDRVLAEVGPGLVPRLEALGARACHWPIGDPKSVDFAFCGRPAATGPYCPAHLALGRRATPALHRRPGAPRSLC